MHYYKFHIPDWNLATAHLSLDEEAVYFRLINFYYDTESPIPTETQSVIRRLRLGSHSETVGLILSEFFTQKDDGWHHKRCDEILAAYHGTAGTNRENGKKGGRPSKKIKDLESEKTQKNPVGFETKPNDNPEETLTINQEPLTTNHKPLTNNQEPETKKTKDRAPRRGALVTSERELLAEIGVEGQLADDFIQLRKTKKAPISKTVIDGIYREAGLAGISPQQAVSLCVERGWQGFRADWLNTRRAALSKSDQTREAMRKFIGEGF